MEDTCEIFRYIYLYIWDCRNFSSLMPLLDNNAVYMIMIRRYSSLVDSLSYNLDGRPLSVLIEAKDCVLWSLDLIRKKFNTLDNLRRNDATFNTGNGGSNEGAGSAGPGSSNIQLRRVVGATYDGVFSNMSVKPSDLYSDSAVTKNVLPDYDNVVDDMSPLYEDDERIFMTVELMQEDIEQNTNQEVLIYKLPTGSSVNFLWHLIISTSFQFIGFLITYFLYNSHAGKNGSRFGLGLTFIGYSYSMMPLNNMKNLQSNGMIKTLDDNELPRVIVPDPNAIDNLNINMDQSTVLDHFKSDLGSKQLKEYNTTSTSSTNELFTVKEIPILSIIVGLLGLFIMIKSIFDYVKVKKMERDYLVQFQV